jgi:hypothetical protein
MRTDQEIIDQTNRLARAFYNLQGYQVPEGYEFNRASHPNERALWHMACAAQFELTETDPNEALVNLDLPPVR